MKLHLIYGLILFICLGFYPVDKHGYIYQKGAFLIYYTTKGSDALPTVKRKDSNKNGTPDFIENIAIQFYTADKLFQDVFKLKSPLNSKRYSGEGVTHIKIKMKNGLKCKGVAFDEITYAQYAGTTVKALEIHLNNKIHYQRATPTHELVHLYQNGYANFTSKWYTEGMARWVEAAIEKGSGVVGKLPKTKKERQELVYKHTYDAALFWNALAQKNTKSEQFHLPEGLASMCYVNGKSVIKDNLFYGSSFLKEVLEQLSSQGNAVELQAGLKAYFQDKSSIKEPNQNEKIWQAIMITCQKLAIDFNFEEL